MNIITKSSFLSLLMAIMLFSGILKAQINTPTGATNPFASNLSYGNGIMPANLPTGGAYGKSQDAADAYNEWKGFYVDQTCAGGTQARVKFDDVNTTVSEGIAYGMLLSAYAADKPLFDKFWAYYKANMDGNSIMNWKVNGCSGTLGSGGATDAEMDAAMALIIASKQWPAATVPYTYSTEASNLITKIKTFEVDNGSFQAINGDGWGFGSSCRNPSYQAPAYYKAFATQNPGESTFWNSAITVGAYPLLNNNAHPTTGLVSDWSDNNGNKNTCNGGFSGFGYDACRNPWRMAVDVLWWNNASGQSICNKIATYVNGQGATNVKGPRNSDGTGGGNHNAVFTAMYAAAIMGTSAANQTLMNSMYTETKNTKDAIQSGYPSGYFGNTLRCISLFAMTGNFWKPGTQANQEINVNVTGTDVLTSTTYDFQNVQNASNKSVTFTIENKGSLPLTIGATVAVTGAAYSVTTQPGTTTLNGGATTTFVVKFTPGSNGVKTGTITITNNDSDENPYVINLTGTGTPSATNSNISVTQSGSNITNNSTFNLGNVTYNSTSTTNTYFTFTINNTGDSPLNITSTPTVTGSGYTLDLAPVSPVAITNGTTTFRIKFSPASTGTKTGSISIPNDDPLKNPFIINLTANAVTCASSITSSNMIEDYESNNNLTPNYVNAAFTTIVNPLVGGNDPSYIVEKYIHPTSSSYDGIQYKLGCGGGTLPTTNILISMLIYSPQTGVPVTMNLKDPSGLVNPYPSISSVTVNTTKANQWERLYFKHTAALSNGNVQYVEIFIDPSSTKGTSGAATYYIDEIKFDTDPCLTDLPTSEIFNDYDNHRNLNLAYNPVGAFNDVYVNPFPTGINTSLTVAKYDRLTTTTYDGIRYVACGANLDLTNKTVVSFQIYSPIAGVPIIFSMKNAAGTSVLDVSSKTTLANTWQTIYFDFAAIKNNATVAKFDIMIDPLHASGAQTYYIDNIKYDINPCYTGIAGTGVMQDYDANRFLNMSNTNAAFNDLIANPSATGINTSATVAKLIRPGTGTYNLIRYQPCGTSFDLSPGRTVYAMDVYSPVANLPITMLMKLADGTTTLVADSVVLAATNTWTTVTFDFTSALSSNLGAYLDIYLDPNITKGAQIYYIDNIRFAPAAPEINVKQNVTNILTGGTFDMGTVVVGSSSSTISFTVQNNGTGNLTLSGAPKIAISGANAADFVIDQTTVIGTVGPVSSTTFTVTFTPSAGGAKSASISITNNDSNENPYTFSLTGTATLPAAPEINIKQGVTNYLTTSTYTFANQNVSTTSAVVTFTIENLGTAALTLSGAPKVAISGTNAANFNIVQPATGSVAIAGTTTFTVSFSPTAVGANTALLTISNNDSDEGTYTINLSGTGIAPEINIKQAATNIASGGNYDFGSVNTSASSGAITFTIENLGTAVLNLTGGTKVAISGTNASEFAVLQPAGASIAAAGNATFTVAFNPLTTGAKTATLTISNNDSDEGTYTIVITGTATLPPAPEINVTDGSTNVLTGTTYDLGSAVNGSAGSTVTFTIENLGTATLNLTGGTLVAKSGTNAADFTVTQPSSASVAASGNVTFTVTFNPSAVGTRTAILTIANNDANEGSYVINLTAVGTAAPAPEINVSESGSNVLTGTTYNMGSLVNLTSGSPVTFAIENLGTATLNLTGGTIVAISGANASDFAVTQPSSSTVAAASNTTFTVTFNPSAVGTRNAMLTITNNDANEGTYTINLQGTSTASPTPEINVQASSVNYLTGSTYAMGSVASGSAGSPVVFTIQNTGTATLNISSVTISGAGNAHFSLDITSMTSTVAAGGTTTVSVTFAPTSTGAKTASLVINNDDTNEGTYTVNLTGTGTTATGINEALNASTKLSPNPCTENITLDLGTTVSGNVEVKVKNMLGEEVQSFSVNGGSEISIQLSNVPVGVYILEITTEQGNVVKRIIKN